MLSIVICTYNRSDMMRSCLTALVDQAVKSSLFEIIIINNNSTDDTQQIAENFVKNYHNIRVVIEGQQGLSHARNRGYKEAKGDYLAYIDDDAIAHNNWIERLLHLIQTSQYDAVGGVYLPWYKDGRPLWMKDAYVSNKQHIEMAIKNISGEYFFCGGNFLIRKDVLVDIQGFSTSIGMTGYAVGYGQEDELQVRMRKKGYLIGFDDKLLVDHYVAPYKQNVQWFIKSKYCKGRDFWIARHQYPYIKELGIYLFLSFYKPFIGLFSLINVFNPNKSQRVKNFIIEELEPGAFYLGLFISGVKLFFNDDRKNKSSS